MTSERRIAIATGTRADWGLLQPLAAELKRRGVILSVIATHQHLMPDMGNTVDEVIRDGYQPAFRIPAAGSPAEIMSQAASGFAEALNHLQPDSIIILGDRCEMLGAASAALLSGVPIIHIAGGTVSEGAFDDSVRHAITKMASLHFPETPLCAARIRQMGENPKMINCVGAIGVESSLNLSKMTKEELADSLGWNPGEHFLVITLHSATLEKQPPLEIQENMLKALKSLDSDIRFLITYPNSDTDPTPLIESLRNFEKEMKGRAKVVPSLGKLRYLSAVALSCGVIGNSSSGLVEVPSLGVPTLDIGIRQKGRECGESVMHCGISEDEITAGLRRILSAEFQQIAAERKNPYYQPSTVERMADIILNTPLPSYPTKQFHLT